MRDGDGVDIAGRACDLNRFARAVRVVGVAVVFDAAFTVEDEHLLGVGLLECVTIGLRWLVHIAAKSLAYVGMSTLHQQSMELTL